MVSSPSLLCSHVKTSRHRQKEVFIIHGRNEIARIAIWDFLEDIGLEPIAWEDAVKATGAGSPYIGQILDAALDRANAVISLMTPDE